MTAIDQLFRNLRATGRKAFMPFITAGDPTLDVTRRLIERLSERGCHLCEIGFPYSDPIADGPVIQASYTRALAHGVRVDDIFKMVKNVPSHVSMPLVGMVSYAIVYRHHVETFAQSARDAGLAGLIVPDLPVEEAPRLSRVCQQLDLNLIQLVTPTTSRPRAIEIARTSTGFLYYVSVTGITGTRQELPSGVLDQVAWLRQQTDLPICIGFGVSRPDHVRTLLQVADGVIVGSALVRYLEQMANQTEAQVLDDLLRLVDELLGAMNA